METNRERDIILEFDKIKQMLSELAVTEYAKNKIAELTPFLEEIQLKRAHSETDGARNILDCMGNPQIPEVAVAKQLLSMIEKDGLLYPEQLEKFARFLSACRRIKGYLKKAEITGKSLAFHGVNIGDFEEIQEEINRCICGNDVDSNASKELCDIRRQIENTTAQMKSKLDELLRTKKQYCNDNFISIKDGHYTLPVKREYKHQVSGSVIAVSSTGTTCFIEPSVTARFNEKLAVLKTEESIEKEKILYAIGALIDQYYEEIKQTIEIIEALDYAFAKGKLSAEMKGISPTINTNRYIKITNGRHPLLNRDACVPVNFEIGNSINGVVITGPNTGGKTVVLKLVGLFSIMAQCGLHLPCEGADICMNSNVLCDIGDGQNIAENLSTFSAHITNIVKILENTGRESLILLDELGSGTDPAEGMGIAIAILEELRRRKCLFVATTHYAEVKTYAENADGLINARMTFDKETLKPQYKLVIGEAGESCAFYVAQKLGFPTHLLDYAQQQTEAYAPVKQTGNHLLLELEETEKGPINSISKVKKIQQPKPLSAHAMSFQIGDSVIVYPDKKMGIIYQTSDKQGVLGVQVQGEKKKINHKRLKLNTPASQLYPPDYDFSIVFDSVENRKARHQMNKKHRPDLEITYEEE